MIAVSGQVLFGSSLKLTGQEVMIAVILNVTHNCKIGLMLILRYQLMAISFSSTSNPLNEGAQ